MSMSELERFVADLHSGSNLFSEVSEGLVGLDALVEKARERGYDFTADEAKQYVRDQHPEETAGLSDADLDAVAGGVGTEAAIGVTTVQVTNVSPGLALVNPMVITYDPSLQVSVVMGAGK